MRTAGRRGEGSKAVETPGAANKAWPGRHRIHGDLLIPAVLPLHVPRLKLDANSIEPNLWVCTELQIMTVYKDNSPNSNTLNLFFPWVSLISEFLVFLSTVHVRL